MMVTIEKWLVEPDENGNGLLSAWLESGEISAPLPVETHNVSIDEVLIGEEQEFNIVLESKSKVDCYKDEDDYYCRSGSKFSHESIIPAGLFAPGNTEAIQSSPRAFINGTIVELYDNAANYGFEETDALVTFVSLGYEFDAVIHEDHSADDYQIGNVLRGEYWVQGWPEE